MFSLLNYEKDAEVFKALAHPVRIEILKELIIRGACNVTQIVGILGIPQSTVSQHLAKMKSSLFQNPLSQSRILSGLMRRM